MSGPMPSRTGLVAWIGGIRTPVQGKAGLALWPDRASPAIAAARRGWLCGSKTGMALCPWPGSGDGSPAAAAGLDCLQATPRSGSGCIRGAPGFDVAAPAFFLERHLGDGIKTVEGMP